MPEKTVGGGLTWTNVVLGAIAAVAILAAIWMLTQTGKPFTFVVDKEGKVSVAVQDGSSFADIVAAAIKKDDENGTHAVEAQLAQYDYYNVNSIKLVDAIGKLGASPEPTAVTLGIRKLLWNLDGPFKGPGTLAHADERFVKVLEELDRPVFEAGDKSELIIALWRRALERESPLGVRTFRASVVPVRPLAEAGGQFVFICPGTGLGNKAVTIWNDRGGLITGVLVEDNRRLPCTQLRVALDRLFAGEPLTLGVDPALYHSLADPQGTGETLPAEVDAFFEVQPARLTALVSIPN